MTLKPIHHTLYVVNGSLSKDWLNYIVTYPLEYGERLLIPQFIFDWLVDSYRVNKVPFICDDTMGGYSSKLEWEASINSYLPESYFPKWLETQSSRYAQRKLLDIL